MMVNLVIMIVVVTVIKVVITIIITTTGNTVRISMIETCGTQVSQMFSL